MKRALVTFAFLCCCSGNNPTDVGSPCTATADCDPAHFCQTQLPGGFCTRGCTFEGSRTDCPGGSICAYAGGTALICAPTCTEAAQCREKDNYECAPVSGSTVKACRIKK